MRDAYDSGGLFPVVVVIVAFVITKILAKLKIIDKNSLDIVAKILSVIVGVAYMFLCYPPPNSFGLVIDFIFCVMFSAIVGGVLYIFILIGVSWGLDEEKE
jgi:hypothetical protein